MDALVPVAVAVGRGEDAEVDEEELVDEEAQEAELADADSAVWPMWGRSTLSSPPGFVGEPRRSSFRYWTALSLLR